MIFVAKIEVLVFHRALLEQFGGQDGFLNEGALDAALIAAENRAWYEAAGLAECAATYAFHLASAHAFLDGNKRVAAAVAETFVVMNGGALEATDQELLDLFLAIAASRMPRSEVETWFREHVVIR